jgi:ABC-type branched-subunit amino acid transport system ATPase component
MLLEMKKLENHILDSDMLKISNLYAGYTKGNPILKGIDLDIDKGDIVGILGRNGSGKSTLAKAVCGLTPYINGEIVFDSVHITGRQPYEIASLGIGFFQQGGCIFPNLTVEENLTFAVANHNKNKKINDLGDYFEIFKNPERLKLKASYLSGGEKHQLALAMVLIQEPKFLILDEPSAGLSPNNQKAIYTILKNIKEFNITMLIIEQNVELVKSFAKRSLQLINGKFENN